MEATDPLQFQSIRLKKPTISVQKPTKSNKKKLHYFTLDTSDKNNMVTFNQSIHRNYIRITKLKTSPKMETRQKKKKKPFLIKRSQL